MTGGGAPRPCPACGRPLQLVFVHGHGQCAACGTNVVPCCTGAGDEVDSSDPGIERARIDTLVEILEARGPMREDDLFNEFATRTGCGWEIGRALLRQAIARGRIVSAAPGVLRAVAS